MVRAQSEREKRAALTIESYYTRYREVGRRGSGRGWGSERMCVAVVVCDVTVPV